MSNGSSVNYSGRKMLEESAGLHLTSPSGCHRATVLDGVRRFADAPGARQAGYWDAGRGGRFFCEPGTLSAVQLEGGRRRHGLGEALLGGDQVSRQSDRSMASGDLAPHEGALPVFKWKVKLELDKEMLHTSISLMQRYLVSGYAEMGRDR